MIDKHGTTVTGTIYKLFTTDQIIATFAAVFEVESYDLSVIDEFTEVSSTGTGDEILMMQFALDAQEELVLSANRFIVTGITEIEIEDCIKALDLSVLDAKLQDLLA